MYGVEFGSPGSVLCFAPAPVAAGWHASALSTRDFEGIALPTEPSGLVLPNALSLALVGLAPRPLRRPS